MRRYTITTIGWMAAATMMTTGALAGEATTDAWAQHGMGQRYGTAGATADYNGDGGRAITRTDTHSGERVTLARGLSVGFDRDGVDLSFSHAIAGRRGGSYAGTLNVSIGRDGSVSNSYGGVLSRGGFERRVEAGGTTRSGRHGTTSLASANGQTRGGGIVRARTHSNHRPGFRAMPRPRPIARLIHRLRH